MKKELKDKLYTPLASLETHETIEQLDEGGFDDLIECFWGHIYFFKATQIENKNKTNEDPNLSHKYDHKKENLAQLFDVLQNIERFLIGRINKDPGSHNKLDLHSWVFCFSDIFVEYLSISERYGSLSQKILQEFLREKDHWIVLFHYLLGKIPQTDQGFSNLFLGYDLRISLQESPFTSGIHVLLECQSFSLLIDFFQLHSMKKKKQRIIEWFKTA